MSDLNEEAKQYFEKYKEGGEDSKPWAFAKALNQSRLDGSIDSLDRIEHLLVQINARFKPDEAFMLRTDIKAFLRLLAYSIGQLIAIHSANEVTWHSYESAVKVSPHDPLPRESWSEVMGVIASSPCLPLGLLIEILKSGKGSMSVRSYAERLIHRYTAPPDMDENQRCQVFLQSFSQGKLPHGGLLFANELVEIKLDYTIESLQGLDSLLVKIRQTQPPDFQQAMATSAYFNFLLWCSYYFGACVARLARVQMKWLSYAEAHNLDPSLEQVFITHHACLLDGRMYFPLAPFGANLFQNLTDRIDIAAYAKQLVSSFPNPLRQISVPREIKTKEECETDVVLHAFYNAGHFAATCMALDCYDGKDSAPKILQPGSTITSGNAIIDFSFFDSAEEAYSTAENMMNHNPERRSFLVYSQDSYANLVSGRKEALTVRLKIFSTSRSTSVNAVETIFLLPYQKADGEQRFRTFSPILQLCELTPGLKTEEALRAFMAGLVTYKFTSPFDHEPFKWQVFLNPQPLL